ncbi:MAG: cyclin-dependent kinase inhibitor 3 family protein [Aestuariivirga sp.]|nr:cyclin-dependent kinase inhibitor 3 family protein [Aestuariivirga sp.]
MMTARTSLSHPLQIAEVTAPGAMGGIGITFCPGKKQPDALTGAWDRDLGIDLDAIRAWGASTVITLVEAHELEELGVTDLGTEVRARGLDWLHLPIGDFSPPDQRFATAFAAHRDRLCSEIRSGARVLVHCKGGLGRAGTVAALLLIDLGTRPDEAIRAVRNVRKGAIETPGQEVYVRAHGPML